MRNVMNHLTRQHVFRNRRKSLITIIGIIISVSMLTVVTTGVASMLNYLEKTEYAVNGKWHASYQKVKSEKLKLLQKNSSIETVTISQEVGYAKIDGAEKSIQPYVYIGAYNEEAYKNQIFDVVKGRLPEKEGELVITLNLYDSDSWTYEVGDDVIFAIGNRYLDEVSDESLLPLFDLSLEQKLSQRDSYLGTKEEPNAASGELGIGGDISAMIYARERFQLTGEKKEYKIVGVIQHPIWIDSPEGGAGYTAMTYSGLDEFVKEEPMVVNVYFNRLSWNGFTQMRNLGKNLECEGTKIEYNDAVLKYRGVTRNTSFNVFLFVLCGGLYSIIGIGSVAFIFNTFKISVAERSKQFGMLLSIGATPRQKKKAVYYEAFLYGVVAIPFGIVIGLLGLRLAFFSINPMLNTILMVENPLELIVSVQIIRLIIFLAFLTIGISCYIPARRAQKMCALEAIRQTNDIKITSKEVKIRKSYQRLFGIVGTLAYKNMIRNKGQYRSLMISLCISIVLFIGVSTYLESLYTSYERTKEITNYDGGIYMVNSNNVDNQEIVQRLREQPSITTVSCIKSITFGQLTEEARANYLNESNINIVKEFYQSERQGESSEDFGYNPSITLIVLDEDNYISYLQVIGHTKEDFIGQGKCEGILINKNRYFFNYRSYEEEPLTIKENDTLKIKKFKEEENQPDQVCEVKVKAITEKIPMGVSYDNSIDGNITIVLPNTEMLYTYVAAEENVSTSYYVTTGDARKMEGEIVASMEAMNRSPLEYNIYNIVQTEERERDLLSIGQIFMYTFLLLISLICLSNMCTTISTSNLLRRREFACLRSMGMTPKVLRKMILFEGFLYGSKALLYGIPISVVITFCISSYINSRFTLTYQIPIKYIIIAGVVVFSVVSVTMLVTTKKIRHANIMDGLRNELE